jgi:hypothetical protein
MRGDLAHFDIPEGHRRRHRCLRLPAHWFAASSESKTSIVSAVLSFSVQ